MMITIKIKLRDFLIVVTLLTLLIATSSVFADRGQNQPAQVTDTSKTLYVPMTNRGTTFYVPQANHGAVEQIASLTSSGNKADADRIQSMIQTPQAVWFTGGGPQEVEQAVREIADRAAGQSAIPVLVAYNVPGRDCSQYSAGGAADGAAYRAWIDGFATGLGDKKAIIILEPDGLALLPSDCGQPDTYNRLDLINYAAHALSRDANAAVYLDAGHSAWHSVNDTAKRLVSAGVRDVKGFFLNISNYQYSANSANYGNWVADCIAYATMVSPGNYSCPDQYWNGGPSNNWQGVAMNAYGEWSDNASDASLNTAGINSRYASLLGETKPTVHFVIDTSRNGAGPWKSTSPSGDPQEWCNPPDRALGIRPTTDTRQPLLDAYLWVKVPGESDGQCYRGSGGPNDAVRGMQDPPAGQWFPEMALELVKNGAPVAQAPQATATQTPENTPENKENPCK